MGRSKDAARKGRNRLLFLIPVVALLAVAVIFVLASLPASTSPVPLKMDFIDQIVVLMENDFGNQTRAILPKLPVGEAGGYWATAQYSSYGADPQHYPLYMNPIVDCVSQNRTSCLLHVRSTVVHNYTLGDFFNVWGQTIGQNNTVGVPRVTNQYGTFAWEMCIGPTGSASPYFQPYGGLALKSGLDITLIFYNTTNGVGCA